jgi:hypothetical protein
VEKLDPGSNPNERTDLEKVAIFTLLQDFRQSLKISDLVLRAMTEDGSNL